MPPVHRAAFTDNPAGLVGGFARAEKTLKALQVRRLYLYPRFHASVSEELDRHTPNVLELHQPLSDRMKEIQDHLAASMRACLRDLRQKCPTVDLSSLFDGSAGRKRKRDAAEGRGAGARRARGSAGGGDVVEDWKCTIRQCIAANFGNQLSRQLEGDWHRLGWDVKRSVGDLKTLSQLFHYLIGEIASEARRGAARGALQCGPHRHRWRAPRLRR